MKMYLTPYVGLAKALNFSLMISGSNVSLFNLLFQNLETFF